MKVRHFNPFQTIDINIPSELHDTYVQYCQRQGNANINMCPFPRMVDLWFLSVCVATRLGLKPIDNSKRSTKKIIDGSIFSSDPWRINILMLIALGLEDDIQILSNPSKMMSIANGLATAGFPKVIDMLEDGDAEPIWNISEAIDTLLNKVKVA